MTDNQPNQKQAIVDNTTFTITIPAEEAQEAYNKMLNQLKKDVSAPGFRKGQVPSKLAEEELGEQNIIQRTLQLVVPDKFQKAMEKADYQPLAQPEFRPVKLEKGDDWEIEVHIAEKPEVSLNGYKNIVKEAKDKAEDLLEKQLEQTKKAQQEAEDQDDQSAASKADKVAPNQTEPTEEQKKNHQLQQIYQSLVEEVGPDIPELLVKTEVRQELDNLARRLEGMNMEIKDFIEKQGMTFEQLSSQFAAEALGRLQLTFVLDAIAEEEGISVSDQEIEEQVDKIEDEKVREQQRQNDQYRALVEQTLKRRKVADFISQL